MIPGDPPAPRYAPDKLERDEGPGKLPENTVRPGRRPLIEYDLRTLRWAVQLGPIRFHVTQRVVWRVTHRLTRRFRRRPAPLVQQIESWSAGYAAGKRVGYDAGWHACIRAVEKRLLSKP